MSEKKPSFVHVSYIASTADKVFAALTDGRFTQEYWAGRVVESDWKKGSPVRIYKRGGEDSVRGVVLECDPPSLLSYTWEQQAAGASRTGATKVTFAIKQVSPNNVRLQIVHEAHEPGSEVHDMVREGWSAISSSLKSYLETGKPLEATQNWEKECR
ncbi:MAG TPA: SRPBCC domain-containing protein [Polyangia bacterium]|nr:SRPBCC domain-containing protein [Polyangia bacterium]